MTKQYFVRKRYNTLHYSTVSERYDTLHELYCTNPAGPTTRSQTQAQQEQGAKREHEGGDDGNAKKRSRFMRMARKLRNKGFEVTCPAEF